MLNYGAEVWGFMNAECIERVHRKFCKYMLNVKISTNNYAVYNEIGRYPLIIERQCRIVKYWSTLLQKSANNCILRGVYSSMEETMKSDGQNVLWLSKLKCLLENTGFAEVWLFPQSVNFKLFLPLLKQRLIDNFLVNLREGLNMSSSMTMYRELKPHFGRAAYLTTLLNKKLRNALSKLRLSSHRLALETGRHTGVERQNRKCAFCVKDDLEDEYHFVLICPRYNNLRTQLIKQYYYRNPSMLKFLQLLNTSGKVLKHLAIYISKAFEERNRALNEITYNR